MMKAITLHQPWASFMAWGLKRIETRSWAPPASLHGQWIAIHAGKNRDSLDDVGLYLRAVRHATPNHGALSDLPSPVEDHHMPLGAIVAVGYLGTVRTTEELTRRDLGADRPLGNYEPGRYGWMFEQINACPEPIPCRGYQQLWDVPEPIAEQLRHLIADRQQGQVHG